MKEVFAYIKFIFNLLMAIGIVIHILLFLYYWLTLDNLAVNK